MDSLVPPEIWYIIFKLRYNLMWKNRASRISSAILKQIKTNIECPKDKTWLHKKNNQWIRVCYSTTFMRCHLMQFIGVDDTFYWHSCITSRIVVVLDNYKCVDITNATNYPETIENHVKLLFNSVIYHPFAPQPPKIGFLQRKGNSMLYEYL